MPWRHYASEEFIATGQLSYRSSRSSANDYRIGWAYSAGTGDRLKVKK